MSVGGTVCMLAVPADALRQQNAVAALSTLCMQHQTCVSTPSAHAKHSCKCALARALLARATAPTAAHTHPHSLHKHLIRHRRSHHRQNRQHQSQRRGGGLTRPRHSGVRGGGRRRAGTRSSLAGGRGLSAWSASMSANGARRRCCASTHPVQRAHQVLLQLLASRHRVANVLKTATIQRNTARQQQQQQHAVVRAARAQPQTARTHASVPSVPACSATISGPPGC